MLPNNSRVLPLRNAVHPPQCYLIMKALFIRRCLSVNPFSRGFASANAASIVLPTNKSFVGPRVFICVTTNFWTLWIGTSWVTLQRNKMFNKRNRNNVRLKNKVQTPRFVPGEWMIRSSKLVLSRTNTTPHRRRRPPEMTFHHETFRVFSNIWVCNLPTAELLWVFHFLVISS